MRYPTPSERRAIGVFLVIVVVILIVAVYGWLSGAWDQVPTPVQ